jgi:hypothetical protein
MPKRNSSNPTVPWAERSDDESTHNVGHIRHYHDKGRIDTDLPAGRRELWQDVGRRR